MTEQLKAAALALVQWHLDFARDQLHVCDKGNDDLAARGMIAEARALRAALAADAVPTEPVGVPEIDYTKLVEAAWKNWGHARGTSGCIAFKHGAEWFRSRVLAAAPQPASEPQPAQWPKLEKPAKVGNGRFGVGVSSRLVVEAAQRHYEYEVTPEKEAARIAEGEAKMVEFQKLLAQPELHFCMSVKPYAERPDETCAMPACWAIGGCQREVVRAEGGEA